MERTPPPLLSIASHFLSAFRELGPSLAQPFGLRGLGRGLPPCRTLHLFPFPNNKFGGRRYAPFFLPFPLARPGSKDNSRLLRTLSGVGRPENRRKGARARAAPRTAANPGSSEGPTHGRPRPPVVVASVWPDPPGGSLGAVASPLTI